MTSSSRQNSKTEQIKWKKIDSSRGKTFTLKGMELEVEERFAFRETVSERLLKFPEYAPDYSFKFRSRYF